MQKRLNPNQLSQIVSDYLGKQVKVNRSTGSWIGETDYDSTITLRKNIFRHALRAPKGDAIWTPFALYVLAHEMGHLARGRAKNPAKDEVRANQWANNNYLNFLGRFGYSHKQAIAARRDAISMFNEFKKGGGIR